MNRESLVLVTVFLLVAVLDHCLRCESATVPPAEPRPFVGLFVFPHGGIVLDPDVRPIDNEPGFQPTSQKEALKLHNAMRNAAKALVKTKPDLVILSTPHGFYLEEHVVLASAPSVSGTAGGYWSNFTASFVIAKDEAIQMYLKLKDNNPVELLTLGIGNSVMPIQWAEVIPWWFIQQAADEANFTLPPVIYIGQSPGRNNTALLNLGMNIAKHSMESWSGRRIAVVISADLSHEHSDASSAPYPFSEVSIVFDNFIKSWAQLDRTRWSEGKSSDILLKDAGAVVDSAGTCGYTGLVMLHGLLSHLVRTGSSFKCHFYEYTAPTYFGMVVTSWLPQ